MVLMVGFQKVRRGKLEVLLTQVTPKYRALEERHGWPPQKLYSCMFGGHDMDTVLSLREWESLSAMEAAHQRIMADPERQELSSQDLIESHRWELYMPVE